MVILLNGSLGAGGARGHRHFRGERNQMHPIKRGPLSAALLAFGLVCTTAMAQQSPVVQPAATPVVPQAPATSAAPPPADAMPAPADRLNATDLEAWLD